MSNWAAQSSLLAFALFASGCSTLAGIEEGSPLAGDGGEPTDGSGVSDVVSWPDAGDSAVAQDAADAADAAACAPGFANCDGNAQNGCETPLGTFEHCSACGDSCKPPNGTGVCDTGKCRVATCPGGLGDCDKVFQNGCEAALNTKTNCGACNNTCVGKLGCNLNPGPQCACLGDSDCNSGSTGACPLGVCVCSGTVCKKGQVCIAGGKCGVP